jgi:hypothetical protein
MNSKLSVRALALTVALALSACGGGGGGDESSTGPVNRAPVANAGSTQSVLTNASVTLTAAGSTDADGNSLTYRWTLVTKPVGSASALSGATLVSPTFTPDVAGDYVFSLVVNDGQVDSASSSVTVTAAVANAAPVANAGTAQNVTTGTLVTLDGSASSDVNGDALTYAWTLTSKPSGSAANLSDATSARPTFTADVVGTYEASLSVSDGRLSSTPATVAIAAAVANVGPVANAGMAQNVTTGTMVTLDGSASSDANGDTLTYVWTLTSKPAGSTAVLSSASSARPTFTADAAGTYVASLVVRDASLASSPMNVTVTAAVANVAPVANASVAQNVTTGTMVTLDGSASSDANGDALTYAWTLTSRPAGSTATLSAATSARPTFSADATGTYVASLVVSDGRLTSTAKTVTVTAAVANVAPVANAGTAQNVTTGTLVTLDGSASSDANGDSLTYAWTLTSKPAGSVAALSAATSARPTFTADAAGTYVASLVVSDGRLSSTGTTVTVTAAVANVAPVANAGTAQNVTTGSLVTLDGSASSDANGDALTYAWTLTSRPAGSTATLSAATSARPTFSADAAGTYVASLVVSDGRLTSTAKTVTVTAAVANVAPVANAGITQNVTTGTLVTLDGSASSDANGDVLTYAWSLTSKPAGSVAALSSATSAKPTFTADASGTYVATLRVSDGLLPSVAQSVTITATLSTATTIAQVNPLLGPVGQWVYVFGSNFVTGQTTVSVGGVSGISASVYGADQLGFAIPSGAAGVSRVIVTSPNGSATSEQMFTVGVPIGATTVTQISPQLGPAGQWVYVYGNNFVSGQTTVSIGGVSAVPATVYSATQLGFAVPTASVGSSRIVVTGPNGTATSDQTFTVGTPEGVPSVSQISPQLGVSGQWVYVIGENFVGGQTTVSVGGISGVPVTVYGPDQIGFAVPTGASGTTRIVVTTPRGSASSIQVFSVQ